MAKERQLALGLDVHEAFKALRLDIADVEVMMDNLERNFGRKSTQRNPLRDLPSLKLPEGGRAAVSVRPRGLHLSARVSHRGRGATITVKEDVDGRLTFELLDYIDKTMTEGVHYAVSGETYNTKTPRVIINLLRDNEYSYVLNIDKQFRTGSAYLSHKGQKLGLTELKEVVNG